MDKISKQIAIYNLIQCAKAVTYVDNYLFASSEIRLANIELDKAVILLEEVCRNLHYDIPTNSYLLIVDVFQYKFAQHNNNVARLEIILKVLQETKDVIEDVLMGCEIPCCMSMQYLITAIGYYKLEIQRCLDKASGNFVVKPNMRAGNYVK